MKSNRNTEGQEVFKNDSEQNLSAIYNIYKVSLTREQQKALSVLLPTNYSFQPFKITCSIDQESLKSSSKHIKKKNTAILSKQAKDPDFSVSNISIPSLVKGQKSFKTESTQVIIPGGEAFNLCYQILKKLKKSLYAWPFRISVDPIALGIPEYPNIVLQPIDLRTIEEILLRKGYQHPSEFHRDIYKMIMNSYKFNPKKSDVFQNTKEFQEEYQKIMKQVKDGKFIYPQKKIKVQDIRFPEGISLREKTSQQFLSQSIKPPQKQISKQQNAQKTYQSKSLEKISDDRKETGREEKQKQKQREHLQKIKIQDNQKESFKKNIDDHFKLKKLSNIAQSQELRIQVKNQFQAEDFLQLKPLKADSKIVKQDNQPSFQNSPYKKKKKNTLKQNKIKSKKSKKVSQLNESPNELKEFKENTQAQSQKNHTYNQIKNKLTELLKKINSSQNPNRMKNKANNKNTQGQDPPNLNNFNAITAAEKKKLAEKISTLNQNELRYVIQICFRNNRCKDRDQKGVYQIDLQKLDLKTLKQLSNLVGMRVKKTKGQSNKNIRQQLRFQQVQYSIEEAQNDGLQFYNLEPGQEQQQSINQHFESKQKQRQYQNFLDNQDRALDQYDNQAHRFGLNDSSENDPRNNYSGDFSF